jgi:hypothetical protein
VLVKLGGDGQRLAAPSFFWEYETANGHKVELV